MRKKQGVTLIELLVVIVTSGIILSTVMASFASLITITHKIDLSRQLQKEINFSLIRIADKMRANSIDYSAYTSGSCSGQSPSSSQKLCLGDGHIFDFNTPIKMLQMNDEPLFSEIFEVRDVFFFYVTPPAAKSPLLQPKLTVYLDVASKQFPEINFQIQTSVSSRQYQP
jgi:hypothetical protein